MPRQRCWAHASRFVSCTIGGLLLSLLPPSAHTPPAHAEERAAMPRTLGDFNQDGWGDLAIGAPGDGGGVVHVLYGTDLGPSSDGNQLWSQASPGVADAPEPGDGFGAGLAWGDFNGDAYDDLAVGVPGESLAEVEDAGALHVLYGSNVGLSAEDAQRFDQANAELGDAAEPSDRFGRVLTTGDFNGDGYGDLAVGVPEEDLVANGDASADAGVVHVLYGSGAGLAPAGGVGIPPAQAWSQASKGVYSPVEDGDRFGGALASADFDRDGVDDVAIAAPTESMLNGNALKKVGQVHVLYGSASGVTAEGNRWFFQGFGGAGDEVSQYDHFGAALAAGDLGGGPADDLAIGIPKEDVGVTADPVVNAGAVQILIGSPDGLRRRFEDVLWTQDTDGVRDVAEEGDRFGSTLAAGSFGKGRRGDLAVGVPFEDVVAPRDDAGAVQVIYGGDGLLVADGNQVFTQAAPGVGEAAEPGDRAGSALVATDLGRTGRDDLAIGVPLEELGAMDQAGVGHVLFGSSAGLRFDTSQLWYQGAGLPGTPGAGERFGATLA